MLTTLEKAKALKEFRGLRVALTSGALKTLEKAKSLKRFRELRVLLNAHSADVAAKIIEYEAQQVEDARKIEDEKQAAIAAKEKAAKDRQDALESTQEWKVLASVADIEKVKQSLETMNRITMNYSKGKAISKDDSKAYDAAQYSLYQVSQGLESIGWSGVGLLGIRKASYKKNKPFFLGDVLNMENVAGKESEQPRDKDFAPLLNSIINGDVSAFDDSTKLTELVDATKESGGDDMPDENKGLFIEAIYAAGVQVLIGKGFQLVD